MAEPHLMTIAWRDFLLFAAGYRPLLDAFETDTGMKFDVDSTMKDFTFWVTSTQWGEIGVPPAFLVQAHAAFPPPPQGD